ncbi:hypothetical protein QBC46DRAFT_343279 [Diplogelasinospora grovesii]|uniref:Uncharacterized protein n=1 Tax=Diplogelasinospora grovesii TaxID=303347 RepID=A0AAN6N3U6_9PEZI|nr:hypothetical protein QBC46DRAFT_343279 [Diplogelasinospora grovesii]
MTKPPARADDDTRYLAVLTDRLAKHVQLDPMSTENYALGFKNTAWWWFHGFPKSVTADRSRGKHAEQQQRDFLRTQINRLLLDTQTSPAQAAAAHFLRMHVPAGTLPHPTAPVGPSTYPPPPLPVRRRRRRQGGSPSRGSPGPMRPQP